MRLVEDGSKNWENRAHFFGAASEAMRRILIERARSKARLKRGGGYERVMVEEIGSMAQTTPDEKLLLIDEALRKMEVEHPERAQVVVLKFFGGLTNHEVANTLGTSERSVDRHWLCAKNWLFRTLSDEFQP